MNGKKNVLPTVLGMALTTSVLMGSVSAATFSDVPSSHWASAAIAKAAATTSYQGTYATKTGSWEDAIKAYERTKW